MKTKTLLSSLIITLLIGCSTQKNSPPFIPTQEVTPFRLPPTWTPTITFTPRPSATFMDIATFTPVPPIPTLSQYTQTADLDNLWENYIAYPSPNGTWIAYWNVLEIKVADTATDRVWTLPCELFERCQYIVPIKWSQNGDILFFGASSYLGGIPQNTTISSYSTAGKINVRTGKWGRLFPDPTGYFDFSISSDDAYVAYTRSVQLEQADSLSVLLTVLNLKNHQEQSYTLGTGFGGNIVWSPFSERFVFQIRDLEAGSSIIYYDVDTDTLRYILKEKKSNFSIQSWQYDNLVFIHETDWEKQNSTFWHLNPFTNEFLEFFAETPKP